MNELLEHPGEPDGNACRANIAATEPRSLRTFTPTQAVISSSAGIYHWTEDGRRLLDFTSGVLVANLGHNPTRWLDRFSKYMGWHPQRSRLHDSTFDSAASNQVVPVPDLPAGYRQAVPMTAYNAITPIEAEASRRLVDFCQRRPGGMRLQKVLWAASGAEAIQKSLWACMAFDRNRPMILATRHGFHGKKGLAGAVTGSEADPERDPRVRFISFPMQECHDLTLRNAPFNTTPYQQELDRLWQEHGSKIGTLITEPYLGGGGSYHPPAAYLQWLERFCRDHKICFILDEVQANFGRTGSLFAYETYGLEPDIVVLGKGLGNGVPVAAAIGRADILDTLNFGEASDTWSANPLSSAAVVATLDEFESQDVIANMNTVSPIIEEGLLGLKQFPFVVHVRGERGGMVWGVETREHAGKNAADWANAIVLESYRGDPASGEGVHLLGPLSKKVIRISPPLVITAEEANRGMAILRQACERLNQH